VADEQLSFLIADLRTFTEQEMIALALDIQANLQEDTPRDTSWARSNWVLSSGVPVDDPSVAEVKNPTPSDVARAAARQADAVAAIVDYNLDQGSIFTTNNVPYIIPLNEGHSKQAGAAFVQRAVGRALNEREARA
jgi:hypothetical protein